MGLFDKKYCDICGEKIGLLGNRKLDDGNLCKECAKKLSPWFEERRHSTVEDIKQQLEYREANKEKYRISVSHDGSQQKSTPYFLMKRREILPLRITWIQKKIRIFCHCQMWFSVIWM